MNHSVKARNGFTLVELLVVIAIIGVLVALLLPAIQAARESARRSHCQNNLHQLGIGLQNYVSSFKMFPAGQQQYSLVGYTWAWCATTLDFFEEGAIRNMIQFEYTPLAFQNSRAVSMKIGVYNCPSTSFRDKHRTPEDVIEDVNHNGKWDPGDGMALTDYAGISGAHTSARNPLTGKYYVANNGVLLGIGPLIKPGQVMLLTAPRIRPAQILDGLSHTILVGELTGRAWDYERDLPNGAWAYGTNVMPIEFGINRRDPAGNPMAWTEQNQLYSDHPGGAHVLCCDGSAHFVAEQIDLTTLQSLCSRDGGEILDGKVFD